MQARDDLLFRNSAATPDEAIALADAVLSFNAREFCGHPPATLTIRRIASDRLLSSPTFDVLTQICALPTPPPHTVCPDCSGLGELALFVSREPCQRCSGSGLLLDAWTVRLIDFATLPLGEALN